MPTVIEQTESFIRSKDAIKAKLRKGGLHWAKRQSGKTTAILELCDEFGPGNCMVMVHGPEMVDFVRRFWNHLFPGVKPPNITIYGKDRLRGLTPTVKLFLDECGLMSNLPNEALDTIRNFYAGTYTDWLRRSRG